MKDFLGNEIKVNDVIVHSMRNTNFPLHKGIVIEVNEKQLICKMEDCTALSYIQKPNRCIVIR